MKKILYLFIVVPLVFSSCSKEDDDNTPNAVQGCTDPAATNYNQNATQDDGSCTYIITGIWGVDDYILNGTSLFSPSLPLYITSMAVNLYTDGTSLTLAYYSDNSELTVNGTWSLIGLSTLRLTNSDGDTVDWTITQLDSQSMQIYANDVGGMGAGTIYLSR